MPMPRDVSSTIRVALADSHPLVVQGLVALLRSQGDLEVVATCRDGREALAAVRDHSPDVVVLDPGFSGIGGLEVIRQIRGANAAVRIVVAEG